MSTQKVFIILLNWNNWNETRECLASLRKVTYDNFEVIVVDNGSEEEEREKIRSVHTTYSIQHTIYSDTNLGFAGGNNVGIRYSLEHGADYIMLLNNDAIVAPDFLTELVKAAESDPSYGILGSKIYKYGTNDVVFNGGKVNRWLTKGEHIKNQELGIMNHEVDYITGAAMLIKREVVEMVGQMREEYFLYYEDVDWCLRACKAGYKCVLVPASKVWHKVSATNKEGSPSYIYYHTRNALMLAKLNGNIFQKATSYFIGAWILFKQIPKFFLIPSKRLWVTSMTRGVLDFYRGKYGRYENRD
jgi:GT2 family glycosyltransferase